MRSYDGRLPHPTYVALCVFIWNMATVSPAWAKVLFHAHFDGSTANADYALGQPRATSATDGFQVAATTDARWGSALNVTNPGANCTFDARQNFNPQRGTASLWFRIQKHEQGMYHPLFGWYRPPHQPGAKKRLSAMEVYLHDSVMTLGLYTPAYKGTSRAAAVEVGKWHHLEINWDCGRGAGKSVYNIFVDGKSVIRVIDGGALADGDGAKLHLGVWDYGFGNILRGQIDEFRITDQIEHSGAFDPPTKPYATPATIEYARETHQVAAQRLQQLRGEIARLTEFSGADGDGATPNFIRGSLATAEKVDKSLAALKPALKANEPDVKALCLALDAVADRLSVARLPIHRIMVEAAAVAAAEDKRSLLFKDLNEELAGDAVILNGKQLFIDDYIIEDADGAQRVLNQMSKELLNAPAVADQDASAVTSGALLYGQRRGLFKMWYIIDDADRKRQLLYYATSNNGVKWKKPRHQPPLTAKDETRIYEQRLHELDWFKRRELAGCLIIASPPLDRFVAVTAGGAGTLTTRQFIAIGDTLVLNVNANQGTIRVEAIDALGRAIKGFSKDDCQPITGDNVRHIVSWKTGTNCHPLQARPIKLRFHLKNAQLYSFEFQIRHNHFVPVSYSQ